MSESTLAGRVVELVRRVAGPGAEAEVGVYHSAEALTRFANSRIHQNVADATTAVRLRLHLDGRTASASTTVIDAAGLESLVERAVAAARMTPPDRTWAGLTPPTPLVARAGQEFDEATARATPEERALRVRDFVRAAEGLETAGYCRTVYASGAFANTAGQTAEGRTVEAGIDGIARLDGADGVARLASGRLADLDGAVLGARAAAKARAGGRPIELPPGRYEVVLEPTAVADLLGNLAMFGFNGKAYAQRQSFAELGAQQFDAAVTISDEPTLALPFDDEGTPRGPLTLVDAGTTAGVTHDRSSAAEAGSVSTGHASPASRSWGPVATHPRLAPAPAPGSGSGSALGSSGSALSDAGGRPGAVATGPVSAGEFAAGPVGAGEFAAGPVGAGEFAAGPVGAGEFAAGPVGAGEFAAGPVGAGGFAASGSLGSGSDAGGPTAQTARPLVATMERGLLITDFWYTRVLDQKSLVITGLTRNGVWLVEDGEVVAAVSNMRFTQSYPQALGPGAVRGIGTESVLLPDRWSGHQFAAPALHLASWNLTGNASG